MLVKIGTEPKGAKGGAKFVGRRGRRNPELSTDLIKLQANKERSEGREEKGGGVGE